MKRPRIFAPLFLLVFLLNTLGAHAAILRLTDVTRSWIYRYAILSAFPEVYEYIPVEENADIECVYHFKEANLPQTYYQRRIELFYTGGDWMEYGLVYFVTDAEQEIPAPGKPIHYWSDTPRAYFIPELSTTDFEGGEIPPQIDPFDSEQLRKFMRTKFLTGKGWVQPKYRPLPVP